MQIGTNGGRSYKEIMRSLGKAVTDAALAEHGGRVHDAMRALGMSKDVWYRVRRDE